MKKFLGVFQRRKTFQVTHDRDHQEKSSVNQVLSREDFVGAVFYPYVSNRPRSQAQNQTQTQTHQNQMPTNKPIRRTQTYGTHLAQSENQQSIRFKRSKSQKSIRSIKSINPNVCNSARGRRQRIRQELDQFDKKIINNIQSSNNKIHNVNRNEYKISNYYNSNNKVQQKFHTNPIQNKTDHENHDYPPLGDRKTANFSLMMISNRPNKKSSNNNVIVRKERNVSKKDIVENKISNVHGSE